MRLDLQVREDLKRMNAKFQMENGGGPPVDRSFEMAPKSIRKSQIDLSASKSNVNLK